MSKPEQPVYGWREQPHDDRDLVYSVAKPIKGLPSKVDLRGNMPPIYNQGQLGSCTANGIARLYQYAENLAGITPVIMPSRLFLYYNEREMEGTINEDAGAIIRDGIKSCNIWGVVDESLWPYDISKFKEEPPISVYDEAKAERIKYYASIQRGNLDQIKLCLSHKFPIVFGTPVYRAFEEYTGGVLELPRRFESSLGGHCMVLAGYDDSVNAGLVANSWGKSYGHDGYLWISFEYIIKLFSDLWMMRLK